MAQSILDSIAVSQKASAALSGGSAEETLVWCDAVTGLLCKSRMDYYREDLGVVFDVKTTEDARPHAVERDVQKWGYHLSAAHYLNGCQARGLPGDNFAWIFIEKKPPYAIGLYFASPDLLLRGKMDMRGYLDSYAECLASDVWPAYSPDFQTIDQPAWAK
jgi:exodeoxyribonuclease VIII